MIATLPAPPSRIGFSGSRFGMSDAQRDTLRQVMLRIEEFAEKRVVFHHGDCLGSDALAQWMAKGLDWITHSHPPDQSVFRAFCAADVVHPTRDYLGRDRNIVHATELLLATPAPNSRGTLYTMNFAIRKRTPVIAINQDGLCRLL